MNGVRAQGTAFRFFVKIDIFYFSDNSLLPSPWHTLPTTILFDPQGLIERILHASAGLRFEITDEDLDYSISKGLAAAHEAYRRTQRQELIFAETLLDELRFHIIQADVWLHDRTPRTQLFSKFDYRGSPEVIQCLRGSFLQLQHRSPPSIAHWVVPAVSSTSRTTPQQVQIIETAAIGFGSA